MARGLKLPVGVDERGRAAIEKDESANTKKILILALQEGGDYNPFQNLGIDKRLIFSTKTSSFQGKALRAIRNVFDKYSLIARLDESRPITFQDEGEGAIAVEVFYIDLLTGNRESLKTTIVGK